MLSLTNLINKIGDMLWMPMIQQSTRDQPTIGCYIVNESIYAAQKWNYLILKVKQMNKAFV